MYNIDSVLIEFFSASDSNISLNKNMKVALIGEDYKDLRKAIKDKYLRQRLLDIGFKDVRVFTSERHFKIIDAIDYDLLLSVRPCEAESLILSAAAIYKKKFAILPCHCKNVHKHTFNLIKTCPVITGIYCSSEKGIDKEGKTFYDNHSWYILHNL